MPALKNPIVLELFMTLNSVILQYFYFLTAHHRYCDVTQTVCPCPYYEIGSRLRANTDTQSSAALVLLESRFREFNLTFRLLHKPSRDALLALLRDLTFSFCTSHFGHNIALKHLLLLTLMHIFLTEN